MDNIKTYVITHKEFELSNYLINEGYSVVSVGNGKFINKGLKDDLGENISGKNSNYCELTALYWIWKNDNINKIKGLCHYRRYFTKAIISKDEKYFLTQKDIEKYFNEGIQYIIPYKSRYVRNADYNYLKCGREKDLSILRDVINEKYPQYIDSYDYIMNHNWSYLTNMMITTAEQWDSYCKWLFDILFEVEKRTDLTGYSNEEARIYGYMSERLLSVWILYNDFKVKELRTVNIEEKRNFGYMLREIMIKLNIYQGIKTFLWKFKVIK